MVRPFASSEELRTFDPVQMHMHTTRMSRNVNLDDEAVSLLESHRRPSESFSKVVKRFVPPPIRTFGDLEKHLENLDGPLIPDIEAVERALAARKKGRHAH